MTAVLQPNLSEVNLYVSIAMNSSSTLNSNSLFSWPSIPPDDQFLDVKNILSLNIKNLVQCLTHGCPPYIITNSKQRRLDNDRHMFTLSV